jgi:hypothetical protein
MVPGCPTRRPCRGHWGRLEWWSCRSPPEMRPAAIIIRDVCPRTPQRNRGAGPIGAAARGAPPHARQPFASCPPRDSLRPRDASIVGGGNPQPLGFRAKIRRSFNNTQPLIGGCLRTGLGAFGSDARDPQFPQFRNGSLCGIPNRWTIHPGKLATVSPADHQTDYLTDAIRRKEPALHPLGDRTACPIRKAELRSKSTHVKQVFQAEQTLPCARNGSTRGRLRRSHRWLRCERWQRGAGLLPRVCSRATAWHAESPRFGGCTDRRVDRFSKHS